MKASNLTIGFLALSAFVLAMILVVLPPNTRQAYADNAVGGDYRLVVSPDNQDCITAFNIREGKMIVYQLTGGGQQHLRIVGTADLATAFNGAPK
jgi:hypothetical protein